MKTWGNVQQLTSRLEKKTRARTSTSTRYECLVMLAKSLSDELSLQKLFSMFGAVIDTESAASNSQSQSRGPAMSVQNMVKGHQSHVLHIVRPPKITAWLDARWFQDVSIRSRPQTHSWYRWAPKGILFGMCELRIVVCGFCRAGPHLPQATATRCGFVSKGHDYSAACKSLLRGSTTVLRGNTELICNRRPHRGAKALFAAKKAVQLM